jgi:transcriptional regulator with XRE-family HTH domain
VRTIAARTKQYREERGLTLDEVAARADTSKSHIWAIEKCRQRSPTVHMVQALARAFGVSMSQMLGEDTGAAALSPEALKVASMFDAELRAALDGVRKGGA